VDRDLYEGSYLYCPRCRTEYRPGVVESCADCGVALVHELPPEPGPPDVDLERLQSTVGPDPVCVLETFDGIQAQIARGALVDAAIPCSVWGSGYYGSLGSRVMVHREDEAEARELLSALFAPEDGPEAGE
jgi:hypothetical protein